MTEEAPSQWTINRAIEGAFGAQCTKLFSVLCNAENFEDDEHFDNALRRFMVGYMHALQAFDAVSKELEVS